MSGSTPQSSADNDGGLTYYQSRGISATGTLDQGVHTCVWSQIVDKSSKRYDV